MLVTPGLGAITLFEATQPIADISFYSESELCLSLTSSYLGNGEVQKTMYHLLDLQKGTLVPLLGQELTQEFTQQHRIYEKTILKEDCPSVDPGISVDIYCINAGGELPLLKDIRFPCYGNGKLYYLRGNVLFCADMEGYEQELLTLARDISNMRVFGDTLVYASVAGNLYSLNLENQIETALEKRAIFQTVYAVQEGVYYVDLEGNLCFQSNDGKQTHIKTNFEITPIYPAESWLYYRTDQYNDFDKFYRTSYWKVGIDETNLGQISFIQG